MTSPLTLFISLFLLSAQLSFVTTCDIWKAAECPTGPSKGDEDLMKSRHYSEEQLSAYCDSGKAFHDCVNEHLLCCDMKHEYNAALTSLDLQLRRNAVRVGRYCAEMNETNPIQYRCRTTVKTFEGIKHRRGSTTTKRWKPICDVDRAVKQCNPMIENRVRFSLQWSAQEKVQWCRDMSDYDACVKTWIRDCSRRSMTNELHQMLIFVDYVHKSANRQCPGGVAGCGVDSQSNDTACVDPLSYFLEQNLRVNHASFVRLNIFLANSLLLLVLVVLLVR